MNSQLSVNTYFSLLKLLTTCVHGCPEIAKTLLTSGILETIRQLLSTSSMLSGGAMGPASSSVVRTADQLQAVVLLASELLPVIPDAPSAVLKGLSLTGSPPPSSSDGTPAAAAGPACERGRFLSEDTALTARFSSQLLPLLLHVYASSVLPQVWHVGPYRLIVFSLVFSYWPHTNMITEYRMKSCCILLFEHP